MWRPPYVHQRSLMPYPVRGKVRLCFLRLLCHFFREADFPIMDLVILMSQRETSICWSREEAEGLGS